MFLPCSLPSIPLEPRLYWWLLSMMEAESSPWINNEEYLAAALFTSSLKHSQHTVRKLKHTHKKVHNEDTGREMVMTALFIVYSWNCLKFINTEMSKMFFIVICNTRVSENEFHITIFVSICEYNIQLELPAEKTPFLSHQTLLSQRTAFLMMAPPLKLPVAQSLPKAL